MSGEVKPSSCPKCGSVALVVDGIGVRFCLACLACGHRGRTGRDKEHAIKMWNQGDEKCLKK